MQAKSQDPGCPSALLKWVVVPDGFYSTAKKRPPASPDIPPHPPVSQTQDHLKLSQESS